MHTFILKFIPNMLKMTLPSVVEHLCRNTAVKYYNLATFTISFLTTEVKLKCIAVDVCSACQSALNTSHTHRFRFCELVFAFHGLFR